MDNQAYTSTTDYRKHGLLYCGKCNEPKQTIVELMGQQVIVDIPCKCFRDSGAKLDSEISEVKAEIRRADAIRFGYSDKKYLDYTFTKDDSPDSPDSKRFRRYVDKWEKVKSENIGLILTGSCGVGKTFYASAIANAVRERYGARIMIYPLPKLIAKMSRNFGAENEDYERMIQTYDLMVIDDFGVERDTEYQSEKVEQIIDLRCRAKKPLIVTTNLTIPEFESSDDIKKQRVFSRLREMCAIYTMTGEDRRKQTQKQTEKSLAEIMR